MSFPDVSEAINLLISHPVAFILFVLGTFGWWRLISLDTVLDRPRNWFWQRFPYEGYQSVEKPKSGTAVMAGGAWYVQKGRWISELIRCPWCLGWWIALIQFVGFVLNPTLTLALSLLHAARIISALCHQALD